MLQDYIQSLRDELQDIERRQKELKILRSQKISQLDQALYRQALEGMPFPPGTKVTEFNYSEPVIVPKGRQWILPAGAFSKCGGPQ